MSKNMSKGAVAIAAGVVLLLGGAGTYALWEVSQPLDGTVQTGDLDLDLTDASWTLNGAPVDDITAVRLVPGDELVLSQGLIVTAIGDDLAAELTIDETAAVIPEEVSEYFDVALDLDAPWADEVGPNRYAVTPGDAPYEANANVTVAFSADTPDREAVNTNLDLSGLEISLHQTL